MRNYNRVENVSQYNQPKYLQEAHNPVWINEHHQNLQVLIDQARADGCIPVLILFPSPEFTHAPQAAKDFADRDLNMDGRWDAFVEALQAIRQNLRDLAAVNGVPLIDANAPFEKLNGDYRAKFQLFVDRMHLTKEGNRLIAQAMYPEIALLIAKIRQEKASR